MSIPLWVYIWMLILRMVRTQAVNQLFVRHSGHRLMHQIVSVSTKNAIDCCRECSEDHDVCNAVAYNEATKECELNNKNPNDFPKYTSVQDSLWNSYYLSLEAYQCEEDWVLFDRHCYYFLRYKHTWNNQDTNCIILESNLVAINSLEENDWVLNRAKYEGFNDRIWIGMYDLTTEGDFGWTSGDNITTWNFAPTEPSGGNYNYCVHLFQDGTWNDENCGYAYEAVCEKENY